MNQTESRIQSSIFKWHWNTYPDERMRLYMVHNTPKNAIDGNRLKALGMVAGVSDLCFIGGDGRTVYIEVKTPEGVQSAVQKKFESVCSRLGVVYVIVRSLEEGQSVIERYR